MHRYYARLNPAKVDDSFLNREEVMRVSDVGAQLGFGISVLHERGLVRHDPNRLAPDDPLPLLTWPCLDFLDSLELADLALLELGAGNSTLWFAQRFGRVRSLETNPDWHRALSGCVPGNVELELVALEALEQAAFDYRGEAFVLVDFAGRRTRFLRHFLSRLGEQRPRAVVLDNADWYRNGARLLVARGYREIPLHGFKSGQSFISCTSVFIDARNALPAIKEPFFRPGFTRRFDNTWDAP
jgi:hypothetical protein